VGPSGWFDLIDELDLWADCGETATLWWRDDDAVRQSPRLERLLVFTERVPISLAVIPAIAEASLVDEVAGSPNVVVLQHGWRHANHAAPFGWSEYPPDRLEREVEAELADGRSRLAALFGAQALPVFVPPYHGFDDRFLPALAACQFVGLSRLGRRLAVQPFSGVAEANVHVSLFDWRIRRFGGDTTTLASILTHLRARRRNEIDRAEPTGILTHHLVQDAASYEFLERLVLLSCAHPAARWLDGYEIFGCRGPA
jgi:hypothetical protein